MKSIKSPVLLGLLTGALAFSVQVQAADAAQESGSGSLSTSFSQLDANQDGFIDAREASASPQVSSLLRSSDKNKDGKLSEAEFVAALSATGK